MSESKQDIVVKLVQEGTHSRQAIKDAADCTSGALASYLSGMRNAAKFTGAPLCPIEVDGVMVCKTFEEVEQIKEERAASRGTAAAKKSPEERLEAAEKRLVRSESALEKFNERIESIDDERAVPEALSLRRDKAAIEVRLAEIEIAQLRTMVSTTDDDEEEEDSDVEEEDLI